MHALEAMYMMVMTKLQSQLMALTFQQTHLTIQPHGFTLKLLNMHQQHTQLEMNKLLQEQDINISLSQQEMQQIIFLKQTIAMQILVLDLQQKLNMPV